jgi:hypothetical protein
MGKRIYIYHHTIAILIPMNWFGCRKKGINNSNIVRNWFGIEAVKSDLGGIIGVGMFFLFSDYQAKPFSVTWNSFHY